MSRLEGFQDGTDDGGSVVYPMDSKKWQYHPQVQAWMGHYLRSLSANYASRNVPKIAAQQEADNAEMNQYYADRGETPPTGEDSWDSIMKVQSEMPELPPSEGPQEDLDVPDWLK
jgi:hypothetical protein